MKTLKFKIQIFCIGILCTFSVFFTHAKADVTSIFFENLCVGDSYDSIVDFLELENFKYETLYNEFDDMYILIYSDVFGNKTEEFSTSLLFNKDRNVKRIFLGLNSSYKDNLNKVYSDVSMILGKPDIISVPSYTGYDINDTELTYFLQFYIAWIKDDGIYVLENDISFYTYAKYSIWDGFEFNIDDDNIQHSSLTVYDRSELDYLINIFE